LVTGINRMHEDHVTPCRLGDGYQVCGDIYCLHFHFDPEDGCRKLLQNAGASLQITQWHDPDCQNTNIQS
jgi:hypothetical protein